MSTPLRIGIAGLGTVGVGVVKILRQKGNMLAQRAGRPIEIVAVNARSKDKDRGVNISSYDWADSPQAIAARDDIDVFVELIGGDAGDALEATKIALSTGKDVVTANKAMLALHGNELAALAEHHGRTIRFEAAVAGGIPVIKALTEGLAGNDVTRVLGVMNGTCNYILTRMEHGGLTYAEAFAEADDLGYLEADPTLDVGGIDAAHKLALLTSIAFGTQVNFDGIKIEGIEHVSIDDIKQAARLGYRIKLLGVAQRTGRGLEQRMSPCLVPANSPLGQLEGGTNMTILEGDEVGTIVLRGAGAGQGPTASAVLSNVMDLARGTRLLPFGQPAASLETPPHSDFETTAPFYLRLSLVDKPGALARVADALAQHGVSIDQMRQYGTCDQSASVLIITHKSMRTALGAALDQLAGSDVLMDTPVALRIEHIT